MELLKVIRDTDIGFNNPDPPAYEERSAARALVYDDGGRIALLHATKKGYHKLPGGGIEPGEDLIDALKRECLEEIGCDIQDIRELGIVEEYRNRLALHQISYCYLAALKGEKGQNRLEEDEIADGFEPEWMNLEDAIRALECEADIAEYEGRFIRLRDLTLLQAAQLRR